MPAFLPFIPLIIAAVTAGGGIASQAIAASGNKSVCEKACKDTCKANHKAFFDGRQKCINGCAAECAAQAQLPPVPEESGINWWYVVSGVLVLAAIGLFIFRKKIAK